MLFIFLNSHDDVFYVKFEYRVYFQLYYILYSILTSQIRRYFQLKDTLPRFLYPLLHTVTLK